MKKIMSGLIYKKIIFFIDSPIFIFLFSIFFCLFTINFENLIGINLDFHPDSLFYIKRSLDITWQEFRPQFIYYYYVKFFSNKEILISINIILYSLSNLFIYTILSKIRNNFKYQFHFFILILFIFNPLRAHYAVHLLKETILIFLLISFFYYKEKIISIFLLILGFFFRPAFIIYILIFVRNKDMRLKKYTILIFISVLIFIFHFYDAILYVIFQTNGNMQFRNFDNIQNFIDLGFQGQIIRSLIWPLLLISGSFSIFSPSIFFLPIAIYNFIYLISCFLISKDFRYFILLFFVISIFAFIVSGFTSFIRYTLPVLTVFPLILFSDLNE